MNDSTFFCIVNNHSYYYLGFYKTSNDTGYPTPAISPSLSDALKLTFEQEAERIVNALGKTQWQVKECEL